MSLSFLNCKFSFDKGVETTFMAITTKQFQLLTDIDLVWDFLVDIYDRENGSGMPAPFFEHAIRAS